MSAGIGFSETEDEATISEGDTSPTEEIVDPFCDYASPKIVTFQDVSAAVYAIRGNVIHTPCFFSHSLSELTNMKIFFKKDFLQVTGSFKERGVRNALELLSAEERERGVIAASAGNHALALAYHGPQVDPPAKVTVVMPRNAPLMKVTRCSQQGATVLQHGDNMHETKSYAMQYANDNGMAYINGYDHPAIIAGQGTMALEIVEDMIKKQQSEILGGRLKKPGFDAIIIPIGGGGLIAGMAVAIKHLYPHVRVIGAEPSRSACYTAAVKAGKPILSECGSTLSDGLAVPLIGCNAFETARRCVDKTVLVDEEFIALAILRLIEMEKAVVEGAGATGLAAVLQGLLPELAGKRVVIPLCGGNIDTTVLGRCIERGLAADGRLARFAVTVSDRPGGVYELTKQLSRHKASIKDIYHERAWLRSDIFTVRVRITVELRDAEHGQIVESALKQIYGDDVESTLADKCV